MTVASSAERRATSILSSSNNLKKSDVIKIGRLQTQAIERAGAVRLSSEESTSDEISIAQGHEAKLGHQGLQHRISLAMSH